MVKRKKGGLFRAARHKWLAEIITFESVSDARKAAKKLVGYVRRGRKGTLRLGEKRALEIVRALVYAANRAEAASKRKTLRIEEKRKLREISRVYRHAAEEADRIYDKKYRR